MIDVFENYHPGRNLIPKHVGLIPDGGRRWAKNHGISYYESYIISMKKIYEIFDYLYSVGVNMISVYFSSSMNYLRPNQEVVDFNNAENEFCESYLKPLVIKYGLHVEFCGNQELIPDGFLATLNSIKERTQDYNAKYLNLCVAYNPLYELWESAKESSTPDAFIENLWISSPLDLIIRTGDANLLSNFLPIQSSFARLYFIDRLFNDISVTDVKDIIKTFSQINRKYGE